MRVLVVALFVLLASTDAVGQRSRRSKAVAEHPQAVGDAGIAWYTTWESGLAEAKRSQRPIFFMAASTTSRGVSGCF